MVNVCVCSAVRIYLWCVGPRTRSTSLCSLEFITFWEAVMNIHDCSNGRKTILKNWSKERLQPLGTGPWTWLSPDCFPGWSASPWVVSGSWLLLTSFLSPPRMLFVTVAPSLSPPASPDHPALPSATLLPSVGCTLQSPAGVGRRGQRPPASDRAAELPALTSPVPG